MNEEDVVYVFNGILLNHKTMKNEILHWDNISELGGC